MPGDSARGAELKGADHGRNYSDAPSLRRRWTGRVHSRFQGRAPRLPLPRTMIVQPRPYRARTFIRAHPPRHPARLPTLLRRLTATLCGCYHRRVVSSRTAVTLLSAGSAAAPAAAAGSAMACDAHSGRSLLYDSPLWGIRLEDSRHVPVPRTRLPAVFQQSHADFQAWTNAYQHMAMAANNAAQGRMTPPAASSSSSSRVQSPVEPEYERRRTISGPAKAGSGSSADAGVPSLPVHAGAGRDSPSDQRTVPSASAVSPLQSAHRPQTITRELAGGQPRRQRYPSIRFHSSSLGRQVLARDESPFRWIQSLQRRTTPICSDRGTRNQHWHLSLSRVSCRLRHRTIDSSQGFRSKVSTPLQPGPITMAMNAQPSPRKSSLGQGAAASPEATEKKSFKSRFRIANHRLRQPSPLPPQPPHRHPRPPLAAQPLKLTPRHPRRPLGLARRP